MKTKRVKDESLNICINEASVSDIAYIQEIAAKVWPSTFGKILSSKQISYMMELMYSSEALTEQIRDKHHRYFLAYAGARCIGFMSIEHHSQLSPRTKIHKAYILPSEQGQGVGRALFDKAAKDAISHGDAAIYLNVNKYNENAIAFYEKYGFTNVKEEVIDIGNGFVMDDFVFEKQLAS